MIAECIHDSKFNFLAIPTSVGTFECIYMFKMFFSNPIRDLFYKFQSIVSTMNKLQRYLSSVLLPQSYVLSLIVSGST